MNNMVSNRFINSRCRWLSERITTMSENRPTAQEEVKIRLKHGQWEVEITCTESKVRQMVEDVLSSLDSSSAPDSGVQLQKQLEELKREVEALKVRAAAAPSLAASFEAGKQVPATAKSAKGGMTCRSLLETLWYESYFGSERSLGDAHEELSRRGYNYDRTAVSHSLTDMVREGILTRTGTMRNYRYIQKRPPGDSPLATSARAEANAANAAVTAATTHQPA